MVVEAKLWFLLFSKTLYSWQQRPHSTRDENTTEKSGDWVKKPRLTISSLYIMMMWKIRTLYWVSSIHSPHSLLPLSKRSSKSMALSCQRSENKRQGRRKMMTRKIDTTIRFRQSDINPAQCSDRCWRYCGQRITRSGCSSTALNRLPQWFTATGSKFESQIVTTGF